MTESGRPGNGIAPEGAHPARVYDYWLGGKNNFAADRAAAEQVLQVMPEIVETVRGNRRFLVRAVAFLRDTGTGSSSTSAAGFRAARTCMRSPKRATLVCAWCMWTTIPWCARMPRR
jgi:hypothetical protein